MQVVVKGKQFHITFKEVTDKQILNGKIGPMQVAKVEESREEPLGGIENNQSRKSELRDQDKVLLLKLGQEDT